MLSMVTGFFERTFRSLFSLLDSAIFWVVQIAFQGIFDIANINLIQEGFVEDLTNRIYALVGVFMLFKLAFSLLNGIVNPDTLSDKERGTSKIVTRVLTAIIMLVMLPEFFNLVSLAQERLLPIVPQIITGYSLPSGQGGVPTPNLSGVGQKMALQAYAPFFHYNEECGESSLDIGGGGTSPDDPSNQLSMDLSNWNPGALIGGPHEINSVQDTYQYVNEPCEKSGDKKDIFMYNYTPILGLIAGGFLIFILIGFCIDVAIRTFKLLVLRVIAPIPIISYIDPKSAKDGAFANWTKSLLSTFLDLFIRLAAIYLIIYIFSMVFNMNTISYIYGQVDGDIFRTLYIILFLIIGLFFFARQFPKFVMNALGIKSSGNLGTGTAFGVGSLAGAISGGLTGAATGSGVLGKVGGFLSGAAAGGVYGGMRSADMANESAVTGRPPQGGAWQTGRDMVRRAVTGNDKAEGGIMNSLNRAMQNQMKASQAYKYGLDEATMDAGRDQLERFKSQYENAEWDYVHGNIQDPTVNREAQTYNDDVIAAQTSYEAAKQESDTLYQTYQNARVAAEQHPGSQEFIDARDHAYAEYTVARAASREASAVLQDKKEARDISMQRYKLDRKTVYEKAAKKYEKADKASSSFKPDTDMNRKKYRGRRDYTPTKTEKKPSAPYRPAKDTPPDIDPTKGMNKY